MSRPPSSASRPHAFECSISFWENVATERTKRLLKHSRPLIDWQKFIKSEDELALIRNKKIRSFYAQQNQQICRYQLVDSILDSPIPKEIIRVYHERENNKPIKTTCQQAVINESLRISNPKEYFANKNSTDLEAQPLLKDVRSINDENDIIQKAILVNFILNVLLLIVKIAVAWYSSSISIFASLIDSLLDFLSTVVIYFATYFANHSHWKQKYKYPVLKTRKRFEPLSVTFFGTVMIMAFTQIAIEATTRLLGNEEHKIVHLPFLSFLTMTVTVLIKFASWVWCKSLNPSTAVDALAQDAMTDVVFNVFAIFFPVFGDFLHLWWVDSLGALVISIYVCAEWLTTVFTHMRRLSGEVANIQIINQLTYMTSRFSDMINHVKAVHVYHAGDLIISEIDVVLDENTSLRDGHDIGESLQLAIESLHDPPIERSFVHLDYSHAEPGGHF